MRITKIVLIISILALLVGCGASEYSSDFSAYKNYSAQQLYTMGQNNLDHKKYDKAVKDFQAIDALYPFGAYAQRGQLAIIKAHYDNGSYESAIAAADRYIHLYPTDSQIAYAYYMRGLAYFNNGKSWVDKIYTKDPAHRDLSPYRKAFKDFSTVATYYSQSSYAHSARKHMVYIRNTIARHELEIAQFYYKRHAYVAAANRAAYLVDHIQGTPQVIPALKIMVKSYRKLGATQQADQAYRVLRRNYPDAVKNL